MKDKPRQDKPKRDVTDAETTRCTNPRYGDMTVAEATRRFMTGGQTPKGSDKKP